MTVGEWLGAENKLGCDIWEHKYQQFIPDSQRKETFDEWLDRISDGNENVKQLVVDKKFLFGGRILANRGMNKHGRKITYSNCYVLDTSDSLEGIYKTAHDLARTYSYGGGCGVDLSPLRPCGSKVNNAANTTTGPLSFAELFEKTTEIIGQEGRRGALMLSMSCDHPDIEKFVTVKENLDKITHANMSVRMTDRFMRDAEKGKSHKQVFHVKSSASDYKIENEVDASAIVNKIAKCNWDMGEPGMLFWDAIESHNLLSNDKRFKFAGVNPCAEEPLPSGGSCCLGSLNLSAFVKDGNFDYDDFAMSARIATDAMNEVLMEGLPLHPLEEQRECVGNWRQIGIGIMGLADCLIKLNERYGSELSLITCRRIGETLCNSVAQRSAELVEKYGVYPMCPDIDSSESPLYSEFAQSVLSEETRDVIKKYGGLVNSQLLTIAPTGTLSTMIGVSGGIEPIFANYYERTTKSLHGEDVVYKVYTPIVKEYMTNFKITSDENLPEYFVTARDIQPINRIEMQSVWQNYIDASISSTVNLPEEATVDDIEDIYIEAWKHGLKGITVFRENCKRAAILNTVTNKEEKEDVQSEDVDITDETILIGKRRKLQTGCVDSDTEFFTGYGWKKISEYKDGDMVLQYNTDGTANLVHPLNYIKRKSEGQYHIESKYGLDMMVSPDHRNVVFGYKDKLEIISTDELIKQHESNKQGFSKRFKKAFDYCGGSGINLTDDEIRIEVAIFADGCFYSETSKKCLVSVHKKRKRDRLVELLDSAGIDYSERLDNDGYYNIKFYPPLSGKEKQFTAEWYNCTKHQMRVIFDEVFLWDGRYEAKNEYSTSIKSNADFIQFVCSSLGYRGSIYKDSRREDGKIYYRVDWSDRIFTSIIESSGKKTIDKVMPSDGYDYCFSVPSTMLVLRRNDKIFVTGNCGSLHVLAYFNPISKKLQEVYLAKGSTGGCQQFMVGLSRTISLLCKSGVDIYTIKDQLDSTGTCPSYATRNATKHDCSKGSCCPMAVGNALVSMYEEFKKESQQPVVYSNKKKEEKENTSDEKTYCPECGAELRHAGGCDTCPECGWSHCG